MKRKLTNLVIHLKNLLFYNNEEKLDKLLIKGFKRMMNSYESNKKKIIDNIELEVLNGMNSIEI